MDEALLRVLAAANASVVIGAVAVMIAAALFSLAYVVASKRLAAPTRELAAAVRVLDRILAYDDAVSSLSAELRDEARRVTSTYHKELR